MSIIAYSDNCSVKGRVVDNNNLPVKNAEVYCEQNLMSPLVQTITDNEGQFSFSGLMEGPTGIFATTEGMAWSGIHINLPAEENITGLEIILIPAKSVKGKVVVLNEKGKEESISGAEIDRFAILGVEKVAIPCSKLIPFGYKRVISDTEGVFLLDKVPVGHTISLKVVHPEYAVTTVENISYEADAKITMSKGCVVLGSVYTIQNDNKVKVANSDVTIKNTQAPYESICVRTNTEGEFTIRLNPGVYMCKAETNQLLSAGWEIKKIANSIGEHIQVQVFPSVYISGQILDAISGKPVPGAKVSIEQGGKKALSLTTGRTGKFRGKVVHGQAYIKFEAIPGYTIPQPSQLRVVVSGKDEIVLPGVWVKKVDSLKVKLVVLQQKVLTTNRGIVSVLNPQQLGWYAGNIDNTFELKLSSTPAEGKIVGYAEIPEENIGNVFTLDSKDMGKVCETNLYTLGTIKGRVVNKERTPISDGIISCVLKEVGTSQEYLLWQILLSADGTFYWNSIIPFKTLLFKLYDNNGSLLWQSSEMQFLEGENKDIGDIIIEKSVTRKNVSSLLRSNYKNLCGGSEIVDMLFKGPSVLVYVDSAEVLFMQEVLANIRNIFGSGINVGMILTNEIDCNDISIPVITGQRPSLATTYLIGEDGNLICETFGLPLMIRMIKK
ncbi:MAG: carboxypeptidase regulatory-like domain-containing protein [Candidatus Hydrogenedens sp.]